MTPEKLGRYEILGELGKGAMGVVYLARDPLIGRKLAIKTFRLGYAAQEREVEQFRARFLREAQSAGILSHPNIVTIHDVVEEPDEGYFIAMEYVKGIDLKQQMQRHGKLDLPYVIDIVAQLADGLAYAHSKGVVHRDVKPANILITAEKQAKITDFGIARIEASNLTVKGQLLGTPNYMAPEQIQGKEVDYKADIFSLGVLLYEMVTGKKPFQGENLTVVTHRVVYDAFMPPSEIVPGLPPHVTVVLDRALQKEPAKRYDSCADMARDLRASGSPPVREAPPLEKPVDQPPPPRTPAKTPPAGVPAPARKATPAPAVKLPAEKFAASETLPVIEPPPVVELPPMPPAEKEPSAGGEPPPTKPPAAVKPPVVKKTPRPAEPQSVRTPTPPPMPTARAGRKPQPAAEQAPAVRSPAAPTTPTKPIKAVSPPPAAEAPTPTKPIKAVVPPAAEAPTPTKPIKAVPPPPAAEAPTPTKPIKAVPPPPAAEALTPTKPIKAVSPPPAAEAPTPTKPIKAVPPPAARPPGRVPSKPSQKSPSRAWAVILVFALLLLSVGTWFFWPSGQPDPDPAESVDAGPVSRLQVEPAPRYDAQTYGMTGESSDAVESETILAYVQERAEAAETLWENKEYERVAELLDQILLVDPEHERALELSEDLRPRQVRRPQPAPTTVPPQPGSASQPAASPKAGTPVSREGALEIIFLTHVAEGQVTVYGNQKLIFQESFDFPDKRRFKRKLLKSPGSLGTNLKLPAGMVALKVEVVLSKVKEDLKNQTETVRGRVSPRSNQTLKITVSEESALSVELQ